MNISIEILKGKTLRSILRDEDEIIFIVDESEKYKMLHYQDCCESVCIEDICGDLDNLVNSPILIAEERTNMNIPKTEDESFTWTFYELATLKGSVTIRWYGTSNGYYSEAVNFCKF